MIIDPPSVYNLSKQDVIEGRNLSVECTATPGHPNSTIFYWTKEDDQLFRRNGSILQFVNIQISSSGTYTCAAQNDYQNKEKGTDRQFMIVNVQCKLVSFVVDRKHRFFTILNIIILNIKNPAESFTFKNSVELFCNSVHLSNISVIYDETVT